MPNPTSTADQYRFEDFLLDTGRGALVRGDKDIALRRQSYEVLLHLVLNHGRLVTREALLEKVWGGKVVTEASITQCLAEIRAALNDTDHRKIRTLTGRGYRFELAVSREGTADASKAGVAESPAEGRIRRRAHRASRVALGVLLLALGLTLWAILWPGREGGAPLSGATAGLSPLVAALPLQNLSPEALSDEFVVGFHDVMLAELSRQPGVAVLGRWTVESLDSEADAPGSLRKFLGADLALSGSVAHDPSGIRFSFQLLETDSGVQLWAENYVEPLSAAELLTVQQLVAKRVAAEAANLASPRTLDVSAKRDLPGFPPTDSFTAYERYLDGSFYLRQVETGNASAEVVAAARLALEAAIEADPTWPPPYAALGRILHFVAPNPAYSGAWWESRQLLEKALDLDPNFGPALASMAYLQFRRERDYKGAERTLLQARDAGETVDWEFGILFTALGRMEESLNHYQRAAASDPLNPVIKAQYGRNLVCDEQWSPAQRIVRQIVDYWNEPKMYLRLALAELNSGHEEQGRARWEKYREAYPDDDGFFYLALGDTDSARVELDRLASIEPIPPWQAYLLAVQLGELDQAFSILEQKAHMNPDSLRFVLCDASMRALEGTPRFDQILQELGLR